MDLDLRLVRYAVAVAEELHYGRASARLSITEQTLSSQIKQLETKLGTVLFLRDRRRVELTPAGEVFVAHGRRLLHAARELVDELTGNPAALVVDVVSEGMTPALVTQDVRTGSDQPAVEIRQGHGLTATLPLLLDGRVDLAFGRLRGVTPEVPGALAHAGVRLEPMGLAVPAGHRLADRPEISMSDAADIPLLVHSPHEAPEWEKWVGELAATHKLKVRKYSYGHGLASAHAMVTISGHGVVCPLDQSRDPDVVVRPLVDPVPILCWSAVWRAEHRMRALAAFVQRVRDHAAELGWLDPPDRAWWTAEADRVDLGSIEGLT